MLEEDVKHGLEQDVVTACECGSKAIAVRELLDNGEGGGRRDVLFVQCEWHVNVQPSISLTFFSTASSAAEYLNALRRRS